MSKMTISWYYALLYFRAAITSVIDSAVIKPTKAFITSYGTTSLQARNIHSFFLGCLSTSVVA